MTILSSVVEVPLIRAICLAVRIHVRVRTNIGTHNRILSPCMRELRDGDHLLQLLRRVLFSDLNAEDRRNEQREDLARNLPPRPCSGATVDSGGPSVFGS